MASRRAVSIVALARGFCPPGNPSYWHTPHRTLRHQHGEGNPPLKTTIALATIVILIAAGCSQQQKKSPAPAPAVTTETPDKPAEPPAPKPALHYGFDAAETALTDQSGNGHDVADDNVGHRLTPGPSGSALAFDGSKTWDLGDATKDLTNKGSFSIAMWIRADIQDSALLAKHRGQVGRSKTGWCVQCENTEAHMWGVRLDICDGTDRPTALLSTGKEALDHDWRHVTFVIDRDAGMGACFLDGEEVQSVPLDGLGATANDNSILLGTRGDWVRFRGEIDELMIFEQALDASAIKKLATKTATD